MENNQNIQVPADKKMFEGLAAKDKPDGVESDHISLFDLHEDMQMADVIPIEELNQKVKEESDSHTLNKALDARAILDKDGPKS